MCILKKKKRKEESPTPTQRSDHSMRTAISGPSHYSHYSGTSAYEASASPEAQQITPYASTTPSPVVTIPSNTSPGHPHPVHEASVPSVPAKQSLTQPSLLQQSSAPPHPASEGSPTQTKRKSGVTESVINSRPASPVKQKSKAAPPAPIPKRQQPVPESVPVVEPPKKMLVRRKIDQVREANDPAYGTLSPYKSEWESAEVVKWVDLKLEDHKKEMNRMEEVAKEENHKGSRKSKRNLKKKSSREMPKEE